MKKFKKIALVLLAIIVSLALLVCGGVFLGHKVLFPVPTSDVPSIEAATDGILTLGVQAHMPQPATIDEYVDVLARQVKRYNEVAPKLWHENALTNQSIIVEEIGKNDFWLIEPDGTIKSLSKDEVLERGAQRTPYFNGFSQFDGGMYVAVAENDITNYLLFEEYPHLGTYDPFITFVHEGFHVQQEDWAEMDEVPNRGRGEFLEDTAARAKRNLLLRQVLKAVSEPNNTQPMFDALATYEDYKAQFPDDYKASIYTDRIEGTAYYYELISCLYSAYPAQIKDESDLESALSLLATREDVYVDYGLVVEGYMIGGFTCVLLDRYVDGWQAKLMDDPEMTPLEMLYQHFDEEALPAAVQLTQAEIDALGVRIQDSSDAGTGPYLLFRFLYDFLF
ncbi:MAG: hypothetical protein FWF11_04715 [Coriobacteriia bacterium]|nr:hypothetical protein [Coriobacteriia bacterium]